MTKQEAAIVSVYTGILIGKFDDMHTYAETKMGYSIFTHRFADKEIVKKLKQLSKEDFAI